MINTCTCYKKRMKSITTKQTSRDKLLDVTFEEIYKYGYSGAGTASIFKKADVPKGSMDPCIIILNQKKSWCWR